MIVTQNRKPYRELKNLAVASNGAAALSVCDFCGEPAVYSCAGKGSNGKSIGDGSNLKEYIDLFIQAAAKAGWKCERGTPNMRTKWRKYANL